VKHQDPHLQAALESIAAISSYRPGTQAEFQADFMARDAVLMRLQDLGENLAKVKQDFPDFWNKHSTRDWQAAIGLRNLISHAYAVIKLELIWEAITNDLPRLEASLRAALPTPGADAPE
jgi:uncharacterized protein with HEPN domain